MIAIDDDDLVAHDEVHMPAIFGVDFDEYLRNRDDAHAGWHSGADLNREVDVGCAGHIAATQHRFPNFGALFRCQRRFAASLALLRLTLWGLALLTLLALLALLTLLTLRGLPLLRRTLIALGLGRALALIALSLAGGLIPVTLSALGLSLALRAVFALGVLILLRVLILLLLGRVACGLIHGTALAPLTLRTWLRTWLRLARLVLGSTAGSTAGLRTAGHVLG